MNYRKKANITLTLVLLGFIGTSVLRYFYKDLVIFKMLFYIMEAALIGGMADWFAVTAIFKKPLGFPFHTAIIPKNRATIVNSVANIVEKEFLSADMIEERLDRINITDRVIAWVDSKAGREYITKVIDKMLSGLRKGTGLKEFYALAEIVAKDSLKGVDMDKHISDLLNWSLRSGEYKKVFLFLLEDIIKAAEGPGVRNRIFNQLESIKAEKTHGLFGTFFNSALEGSNIINIGELADSIHMHLIETLYNLKDENNLMTKYLMSTIEEHLLLNARNPFANDEMTDIKDNLISNLFNEQMLYSLLAVIQEGLIKFNDDNERALVNTGESKMMGSIVEQVNISWNSFKNNENIKYSVEGFIKKSISNLIAKEHNVIGKIVRDTLESFDDDDLNKFIEDRAGNDLQWIRMNGSIVGGMIGLLVFLFQYYFYVPIAIPFIKSLFS